MTTTEIVSFDRFRLKAARIKAGLTQQTLAELTGLALSSISKYELGERKPRPRTLQTIASTIGRPPRYFYGLDDEPTSPE